MIQCHRGGGPGIAGINDENILHWEDANNYFYTKFEDGRLKIIVKDAGVDNAVESWGRKA